MKILVTTDNHIGFAEQDPIRGDDAARTLEEIMDLAVESQVDCVIQAGDLFHLSRPSKRSFYDVLKIFRRTCLGDKPIEFQVLYHPILSTDPEFDVVNFEDPNINVAIPIFAISGNHDDAGGTSSLAPMDVLGMTGLLNHFGRVADNDSIEIAPILMKKGDTCIALYGLASVRDERLHRTFRDGRVTFLRPETDPERWYSILCVHQNHGAHSATNHLPENFLPSFLNLVIWGHEHECVIDPWLNTRHGFRVLQPGSSVATSLSEAETVQKHVFILDIEGKDLDVRPVKLQTVRPFAMETMTLADSGIKPTRNSKEQTSQWIVKQIERLIEKATTEWRQRNPDVSTDPPLPLVRLRVEYTGEYEVENPIRLSNRFADRVANPHDIIKYSKRREKTEKADSKRGFALQTGNASTGEQGTDPDKIDLSELMRELLKDEQLAVLPEAGMDEALTRYVDKDDKGALKEFVDESLWQKIANIMGEDPVNEGSTGAGSRAGHTSAKGSHRATGGAKSAPIVLADDVADAEKATERHAAALDANTDSDFMEVDESDVEVRTRGRKAKKSQPAPPKKRTRKAPARHPAQASPPRKSARTRQNPARENPIEEGAVDSDDGFD